MSASTGSRKTTASTSASAKKPLRTSKATASVPIEKTIASVPAKVAPAKVPAKIVPARVPAKRQTSREAMLARVESVRLAQRSEANFDCFGRASGGFCDQGDCIYHAECLSISGLLHSL